MIKNKKAEGAPIWIVIALVLGVIVLVMLALGFSMGWSDLLAKFNIFSGTQLSDVMKACGIACSSETETDFCKDRNFKLTNDDKKLLVDENGLGTYSSKTKRISDLTCEELSFAGLIETCAAVDCSSRLSNVKSVCGVICQKENEKDYCDEERSFRVDDVDREKLEGGEGIIYSDRTRKVSGVTCEKLEDLDILEKCPNITCAEEEE